MRRALERGFSLLEMVIALAILSIGLIGSMRVFPVGLRASHRAERVSRATMVAQRTLASLKLLPCAQLANATDTGDGFTVTTTLFQPPVQLPAGAGGLKGADVTVAWAQDDRTREATFVTYMRCAPESQG